MAVRNVSAGPKSILAMKIWGKKASIFHIQPTSAIDKRGQTLWNGEGLGLDLASGLVGVCSLTVVPGGQPPEVINQGFHMYSEM